MSKKLLIRLIAKLLKEEFSLTELSQFRIRLAGGELLNVFEEAVDVAIESKTADEWQEKNV